MNPDTDTHSSDNKKYSEKINDQVLSITNGIRQGNKGWLNGEGICEWCGSHKAEYNMDLSQGTHRECWWCWNE